jgi:hypothetical protein
MSRGFVSFGAGGPRVGVVLSRKEAGQALAAIVVPFGVLALFGICMERLGDVAGFVAASIVVAMFWRACTLQPRDPRNDPPMRFHDD